MHIFSDQFITYINIVLTAGEEIEKSHEEEKEEVNIIRCKYFVSIIRDFVVKFEALATGTSKRLYLTPTLIVLVTLLPKEFTLAVTIDSRNTGHTVIVNKILKLIISSLRPTAFQSFIKHVNLFVELSFISFLYAIHIDSLLQNNTSDNKTSFTAIAEFARPHFARIMEMALTMDYPSSMYLLSHL